MKTHLPCGTRAAYRRHQYNHEQPCERCATANAEYEAARATRLIAPLTKDPYPSPSAPTTLLLAQSEPWMVNARCRKVADPDTFFPTDSTVGEARKFCAECPVKWECLQYALENNEQFGIWGGYTEHQREKMRAKAREQVS